MSGGASIYILLCADGSYYTGIPRRSVEERLSFRRPVVIVHSEHRERIDEAIAAERRIKGGSRAKKEAFPRGDYERLSKLAKRGGGGA